MTDVRNYGVTELGMEEYEQLCGGGWYEFGRALHLALHPHQAVGAFFDSLN